MFRKWRKLWVTLFILLVSTLAVCLTLNQYSASRETSVQINGYRIDFVYGYDPEFIETCLQITRLDGKRANALCKIQHVTCPQLVIQHTDSRLYFLCSDQEISGSPFYSVPYLDTETMLLYNTNWDDIPIAIYSLNFQ